MLMSSEAPLFWLRALMYGLNALYSISYTNIVPPTDISRSRQQIPESPGSRGFPGLGLGFGIHSQNPGLGIAGSQIAEPWI